MTGPERLFAITAASLFGLVIGSFLNVVIYRVPRGESIVSPGSRCPKCLTPLTALDNIPVLSWVALRGRCRHCGEPISARYPLVEGLTAAAFGATAAVIPNLVVLLPLVVLAAVAVVVAAIDLDGLEPPGAVLYPLGLAVAWLAVVAVAGLHWSRLGWSAAGGAGCAGLWLVTGRESLGSRGAARPRRPMTAVVPAAFGWCAGWLWAPGGLVVFAAIGSLAAAFMVGRTARGPSRIEGSSWRVPLWAVCAAGLASVLACAALGTG